MNSPSPLMPQLFLLISLFLIFYFLLLKPQKDKQKEHKNMVGNLQKNDEIVTIGGIHGTITNIKDKTFILRVDENVKIEVDKNAVGRVEKRQGQE